MQQTKSQNTWVIIPAFNEDEVLREVVSEVVRAGYSVAIIDDGSTTPSKTYLTGLDCLVVRHPMNLGQGAALQTGIDVALARGASCIVTFDADGQHRTEEIHAFVSAVNENEVDVALGSRFCPGGEAVSIPLRKLCVLRAAVLFTRLTTGLKLTDTHNGFRAFSAAAAARLCITQNGMAHASQILSQIGEYKLRYTEVPTRIRYTEYSKRKGQRISNMFNILWDSVMEVFHR